MAQSLENAGITKLQPHGFATLGVQFLLPQCISNVSQALCFALLSCLCLSYRMADPLKLFIGRLHPWVTRDQLLWWMSTLTQIQPVDIWVLPATSGGQRAAFATYRRTSQ